MQLDSQFIIWGAALVLILTIAIMHIVSSRALIAIQVFFEFKLPSTRRRERLVELTKEIHNLKIRNLPFNDEVFELCELCDRLYESHYPDIARAVKKLSQHGIEVYNATSNHDEPCFVYRVVKKD